MQQWWHLPNLRSPNSTRLTESYLIGKRHVLCLSTLWKLLFCMPQCENHPDSSWFILQSLWVFFAVCFYCPHNIDWWLLQLLQWGMLVKKLSMYTTVSLSRSCITGSVITRCAKPLWEFLPLFPVHTWKSHRYPQHEQTNSQVLVLFLIGFIGRYCLKGFFPFPFTICSSTQMCWPIL